MTVRVTPSRAIPAWDGAGSTYRQHEADRCRQKRACSAIVAALVVLVTFRRTGAPLMAGQLTSAGVRPAFYAAGIWVLSQMLWTPISALLGAGPGSHDFPAITV